MDSSHQMNMFCICIYLSRGVSNLYTVICLCETQMENFHATKLMSKVHLEVVTIVIMEKSSIKFLQNKIVFHKITVWDNMRVSKWVFIFGQIVLLTSWHLVDLLWELFPMVRGIKCVCVCARVRVCVCAHMRVCLVYPGKEMTIRQLEKKRIWVKQ